ncbi:unnamed protein product [Acanthoscelides obtectus]|nr:unnamed protein product [Acanthoscelides obtectus]CAK1630615.1 hypothetical protein AOBTE_LOCUS6452 [Acanthoscelides obtectus]
MQYQELFMAVGSKRLLTGYGFHCGSFQYWSRTSRCFFGDCFFFSTGCWSVINAFLWATCHNST